MRHWLGYKNFSNRITLSKRFSLKFANDVNIIYHIANQINFSNVNLKGNDSRSSGNTFFKT